MRRQFTWQQPSSRWFDAGKRRSGSARQLHAGKVPKPSLNTAAGVPAGSSAGCLGWVARWALAASLSACAPAPPKPPPAPPPPPSAQELARQATEARGASALRKGIAEYEAASYQQAEATLLSADIWAANDAIRIAALKHLAFIYCVTERTVLCRQSFERALQLDPNFDLDLTERSHPLWGPQFNAAKAPDKG